MQQRLAQRAAKLHLPARVMVLPLVQGVEGGFLVRVDVNDHLGKSERAGEWYGRLGRQEAEVTLKLMRKWKVEKAANCVEVYKEAEEREKKPESGVKVKDEEGRRKLTERINGWKESYNDGKDE